MPDQLQLRIVTPERLVVEDAALQVQIPAKNGEIGVLPGHAPLITELAVGEIAYRPAKNGGGTKHLAVAWGFAEVLPDRVTILAETAERAEDIDVVRAERARDRAEQRLNKPGSEEVDFQRCQVALQRALVRLQVAGKRQ
jgi:F-type H+-transporting ATPase subunit epsilon